MRWLGLVAFQLATPVAGLVASSGATVVRRAVASLDAQSLQLEASFYPGPLPYVTERVGEMEVPAQQLVPAALQKTQCDSCQGIIDYPRLLRLAEYRWIVALGLLLWGLALIWLLNTTAQDFFVPPLTYWSRMLRLRPELAGATLVALGNGAPDVFAVATATGDKDLPLALTELLGANMCVLCITGGAVVLASNYMQLTQKDAKPIVGQHYVESAAAYGLALVYMLNLMREGRATTLTATCMPLLYVFYLTTMLRQGSIRCPELEFEELGKSDLILEPEPLTGIGRPPSGSSQVELAMWAAAWPTYAIRWVLIPPADMQWDRCRRLVSSLAPVGLCIFCGLTSSSSWEGLLGPTQLLLLALATLMGSCIFSFSDDGPAVPKFYSALTLFSKVSSILVLSAIAGEITALVESVGLVLGVPRLWLGSTVIAWGNSLGDLVTGVAMVKRGQTRTALTSVLAGPLFSCLVGAGTALALAARRGGGEVQLWGASAGQASLLTNVAFLVAAWGMLATMLFTRQRSSTQWAYSLFGLYGLFLVCILVIERLDTQGDFPGATSETLTLSPM